MKFIAAMVLAAGLAGSVAAQPVTPAFTYQGVLSSAGQPQATPVDLRFRLYSAAAGGVQVGPVLQSLGVSPQAGRFAVTLDFGASAFSTGERRWLEVDVRPAGGGAYTTLAGRQELTATPYAGYASSAATAASATTAVNATTASTAANATQLNGQAAAFYTNASNLSGGTLPGGRLGGTYANAVVMSNAGNVITGTFSGDGAGLAGLWRLGGNAGTNPGTQFLGTTDNQPVQVRSNNRRVSSAGFAQGTFGAGGEFRSANLLAGSELNAVGAGVAGATIAGGGIDLYNQGSPGRWANAVSANFGTVGGGTGNQVAGEWGTIAGGNWGTISAQASYSFIGAGNENAIGTAAIYSVIGGGFSNRALAPYVNIAGGAINTSYAGATFMGGGDRNTIGTAGDTVTGTGAVIAGGSNNVINGSYSVIAGGANNQSLVGNGVISGGTDNQVRAFAGAVGGGQLNYVNGEKSVIGGGYGNYVGRLLSVVGGGQWNRVANGVSPFGLAVIGGGYANELAADFGVIGGGRENTITGAETVVSGGRSNTAGGFNSTVGGGYANTVQSDYGVVAGGYGNSVTNNFGAIAGGYGNVVTGEYALVGGGYVNNASAPLGFIGGGRDNTVQGAETVVAGGRANAAGGFNSAVGGGYGNAASGSYSAIPGGTGNTASGDHSFAAGRRAKALHQGAFVLADSQDADFGSSSADSLSIRAAGGVAINRTTQIGLGALAVRGQYSNTFAGMYVDGVGSSSLPFYGYAVDGAAVSYHYFQGSATPGNRAWILNVGGSVPLVARADGSVQVTGSLSKGGGSFKIDHPLDPRNKYLYHSFVESPDMMNIYNGMITTDAAGYATVTLPEWFDALNREFRYQLTVVDDGETAGDFVLTRVVRKIEGNAFVIKTSQPNVEVSWQVTGVRKDAWAEQNRIPVSVDKEPENKGRYLHPAAFGQPEARGIMHGKGPGEVPAGVAGDVTPASSR